MLINILIVVVEWSLYGYCLGFVVFVVVMLLFIEDEEASFWMFVGFMEDVLLSVILCLCINLYVEVKYIDLDVMFYEFELVVYLNEGDCRSSVVVVGLFTRVGLGVFFIESVF